MPEAERARYLGDIVEELKKQWPDNRTVNVVCHGHSVPSGYFATPFVDTFHAYPFLLHRLLKERFPYAVVNVIVTAIGGENSLQGAERFAETVLCHRPDVLTIDYGLNDRGLAPDAVDRAWRSMVAAARGRGTKVLLMTPTWDVSPLKPTGRRDWAALRERARSIRRCAEECGVGLVDSFEAFQGYVRESGELTDLLSWVNHPNARGHELVARELMRWFSYR